MKRLSSSALQNFSASLKEIHESNNEEKIKDISNGKEKQSISKEITVKTKIFDNICVVPLKKNVNLIPIDKSLLLYRQSKIKKTKRAPVNAYSFAVSKGFILNR